MRTAREPEICLETMKTVANVAVAYVRASDTSPADSGS